MSRDRFSWTPRVFLSYARKDGEEYARDLRIKLQTKQPGSECSRLIANCIIFYNATLLSKLLAHKESRGDMQGAALVKQVSPVVWQHVNLYGRYEFRKQPEPVDVDEIVRELAEIRIGTETALAA